MNPQKIEPQPSTPRTLGNFGTKALGNLGHILGQKYFTCLCKKITILANISNFEKEYNHKGIEIDERIVYNTFPSRSP